MFSTTPILPDPPDLSISEAAPAARPRRRHRPLVEDRVQLSLTEAPARWTPHLKEQLILAMRRRAITRPKVRRVYGLSDEELDLWLSRYHQFGFDGLRSTKIQVGRK